MRAVLATLLILLIATTAFAQTPGKSGSGDGDEITLFEADDAVMNAAIAEAQASLPRFLQETLGRAVDATVKVAFQTFPRDVGNEIIWVRDISQRADGSFTGFLDNAPVNLGDWREGTQVQFTQEMIEDWSLVSPNGRLWGNYTTRVIAAMPGNGYLWDYMEPSPLPPGW